MAVKKKNQPGSNQEKNRSGANKLFDMLNPNSMLNNAQKVISSAVNVLEEEIAAGIIAAKKIEKKVINVEEIRDDSQNLMNRIRRDTHEALDIFLDALAALSKQIGLLTESVGKEKGTVTKPAAAAPGTPNPLQIIEHDGTVSPGQEVTLSLLLSDDSIKKPVKLDLQKSDFTGPGDKRIPSGQIRVKPVSLVLKPGEEKEIAISVTLPKNCQAGHYNSLLTIPQMPAVKIILCFEVK
ncbi:MAG: hypothetical protein H7Y01_12455 [Ferruginibacter sp.]|nr:hypothetical protein [Chitinophagaceae bacterium]